MTTSHGHDRSTWNTGTPGDVGAWPQGQTSLELRCTHLMCDASCMTNHISKCLPHPAKFAPNLLTCCGFMCFGMAQALRRSPNHMRADS